MEPGAVLMLAGLFALIITGVVYGKRQALGHAAVSSMRIIKRLLPGGLTTKDDRNGDE